MTEPLHLSEITVAGRCDPQPYSGIDYNIVLDYSQLKVLSTNQEWGEVEGGYGPVRCKMGITPTQYIPLSLRARLKGTDGYVTAWSVPHTYVPEPALALSLLCGVAMLKAMQWWRGR